MKEYRSLCHTMWNCKYHAGFFPSGASTSLSGSCVVSRAFSTSVDNCPLGVGTEMRYPMEPLHRANIGISNTNGRHQLSLKMEPRESWPIRT